MQQSKPQRRRLLKFWGMLPTKGGVEVRKGPLLPFPFPCEGQFPQHYKYSAGGALPHCQALAELVVTRAGCWLLGEPGEGAQAQAEGPPRPQAPCALRFTSNSPWWWVLGAGCGAYDCDCVWVCASNKARRCCSCMCHAAAAACAAVAAFGGAAVRLLSSVTLRPLSLALRGTGLSSPRGVRIGSGFSSSALLGTGVALAGLLCIALRNRLLQCK
jgi:hypothetical protein